MILHMICLPNQKLSKQLKLRSKSRRFHFVFKPLGVSILDVVLMSCFRLVSIDGVVGPPDSSQTQHSQNSIGPPQTLWLQCLEREAVIFVFSVAQAFFFLPLLSPVSFTFRVRSLEFRVVRYRSLH